MIKGKDLILSIDGVKVAASKSCEISLDRDTIEVCSPADGMWRSYKPTACGWSISTNGLCSSMNNVKNLMDALTNGSLVFVGFDDNTATTGTFKRGGYAVITKCTLTGSVGSLVQYSVQLQGSGILTDYKVVYAEYGDYAKQLVFDDTDVFYSAVKDTENVYMNLNVNSGAFIEILAEDRQKWALCVGEYANYDQDIFNGYDLDYVNRGEGYAKIPITNGGRYVILSDDTVCVACCRICG